MSLNVATRDWICSRFRPVYVQVYTRYLYNNISCERLQIAQIVVGPVLQVVHGNRRLRHREKTVRQLGRREEDIGQKTEGGRRAQQNQQIGVPAAVERGECLVRSFSRLLS